MRVRYLLVLLLAFTVSACGDDAPTDDGGNNNGGTFKNETKGTVNGAEWSATNIIATRNDMGGLTVLTFTAHGAAESRISFGIANASVRAFTIDGGPVQADYRYQGKSFKGNGGTITIEVLTDKGMRGSFTVSAATTGGETGSASGTFDVGF